MRLGNDIEIIIIMIIIIIIIIMIIIIIIIIIIIMIIIIIIIIIIMIMIHLEDRNDTEALKLNDLFDTLNYKQHITTRTHKSGHTLDVVITRDNENLISQWKVGDQLSDHNLILCDVSHPKPRPIQVPMSVRKLCSVNMPNFRGLEGRSTTW